MFILYELYKTENPLENIDTNSISYQDENEHENNENELTRYFCCRKRFIYHPLPNAEPNEPPPPALAAIGSNVSIPGVAAPTKGVESC